MLVAKTRFLLFFSLYILLLLLLLLLLLFLLARMCCFIFVWQNELRTRELKGVTVLSRARMHCGITVS